MKKTIVVLLALCLVLSLAGLEKAVREAAEWEDEEKDTMPEL